MNSESEILKNNNQSTNKASKSRVEHDDVTNRVLTAFGGGVLLIIASSMMRRGLNYAASILFTLKFIDVAIIASIVLCCAGIVLNIWQISKKKYNAKTLINGTGLLLFSALFGFCAYLMIGFGAENAIRTIYVLIPAFAMLYLIYSVYPREFFVCSCVLSSTALFTWLLSRSIGSNAMTGAVPLFFACGVAVCAITEIGFLLSAKSGGVLKIGKIKIQLFGPHTKHLMIAIVCAACVALLVATLFLGAPYGYYAMFAAISALFVMAVYYTVKMM